MTNYRRSYVPGATWFFTVNTQQRDTRLLTDNIVLVRNAFQYVKTRHPLQMDAVVILPDHIHCLWTLPMGDVRYATRWSLFKSYFSRNLPTAEPCSMSRLIRGERGVWQRRFWEHLIRDQSDYERHAHYIHWNPVKHRHVRKVSDWPWSSFHRWVERGIYPSDWGGEGVVDLTAGE